jgi:hypothetical protein
LHDPIDPLAVLGKLGPDRFSALTIEIECSKLRRPDSHREAILALAQRLLGSHGFTSHLRFSDLALNGPYQTGKIVLEETIVCSDFVIVTAKSSPMAPEIMINGIPGKLLRRILNVQRASNWAM